jgi:hypothetical protein
MQQWVAKYSTRSRRNSGETGTSCKSTVEAILGDWRKKRLGNGQKSHCGIGDPFLTATSAIGVGGSKERWRPRSETKSCYQGDVPSLHRTSCTYSPSLWERHSKKHGRIEMPGHAHTVSSSGCINARATGRALDIKRLERDLTRKSVGYDVHKQWLGQELIVHAELSYDSYGEWIKGRRKREATSHG